MLALRLHAFAATARVGLTLVLGLMKSALACILCLLTGIGAGWLAAKHVLYAKEFEQDATMLRFNAESQVVFSLSNIRNASTGNTPEILRINCQIAKSAVRLVDPLAYADPQKQREIGKIRQDGLRMVASLTSSGNCGPAQ